jgi:histone H3/H4
VIAFDFACSLNRRQRMRKAIDALSFKKKLILAEELPLLVAEGDYSAALDMIDMRSFYNRLLTCIRTAQSEFLFCIDAWSMERMIFAVLASLTSTSEIQFTREAVLLLHTAAEHYLQSLLEEANLVSIHSGRRIVLCVDLDLATKMRCHR